MNVFCELIHSGLRVWIFRFLLSTLVFTRQKPKSENRKFIIKKQTQLMIITLLFICLCSVDTDAVIRVTSTRYNKNSLKLPIAGPWSAWYNDGQVC